MSTLTALLAAACSLLLARPRAPVRSPRRESATAVDRDAVLRRLRVPLVALAALGGWAVLDGWFGVAAGLVAGLVGWRVLGRVESPAVAARRAVLERDLPMAVHLLGAALAAGAAPAGAVLDVAEAFGGPIGEELRGTHHRLLLGVDPATVWRGLEGPLQPLGRTMVRAHESGAPVRAAVERLAEDLRAGARVKVEALARSVEVRASAPLGVCFLPAFVVLGVVPMAVGIFSSLKLFA